ncbi:MAG: hypothetical protein QME51_03895 [Planctomycetota bacterium]|nr:hypothetical protein [Planctomycetota bacterium]MDI6787491.1 hypothetical protein [Planctomycetota bacterium]
MKNIFRRIADFFAINKTTGIVLLTILLFGFGEELWSAYIPAYLNVWMYASPQYLLITASIVGIVGAAIFYLLVGAKGKDTPQQEN